MNALVKSFTLASLLASPLSYSTDEFQHQIRFGGWTNHLEEEEYKDEFQFNETHNGIGYYYRINECNGKEQWYCQLGAAYLKDSFDGDMYILGGSWNYRVNDYFSAGLFAGITSRTFLHFHNGKPDHRYRKIMPVAAPTLELNYHRYSVGFALLPYSNGDFEFGKPTLFWDLAIAF